MAHPYRFLSLLPLVLLGTDALLAQSNDEVYSALQFNLSNPGARSLSLGGAFLGRPDDATAAYANPAGLTTLDRPEVSAEYRSWNFTSEFVESGTIQAPGSRQGLRLERTDDRTSGLSFLSFVYPRGRFAFGLFRHEAVNYELNFGTRGVAIGGSTGFLRPTSATLDLEVESLGASLGFAIYESDDLSSAFRIGVTLSHQELSLVSETVRFDALAPAGPPSFDLDCAGGQDIAPSGAPDPIVANCQQGESDDATVTIGLLWQQSRSFSIGAVYRQGSEFTYAAADIDRRAIVFPVRRDFLRLEGTFEGRFSVPDVIGVGVALRPRERLLLSLEVDRIEYSVLASSLLNVIGLPRETLGETSDASDFQVKDGKEIRLGLQYDLISDDRPTDYFLRLGFWLDPDHRIEYVGPPDGQLSVSQQALRTTWLPGDDEWRYAVGFGVRTRRFVIDVGADFGESRDNVAVSFVLPF